MDEWKLSTTETTKCYTLDTEIERQNVHICVIVDLLVKSGDNASITIETPHETRCRTDEVRPDDKWAFGFFLCSVKTMADALCKIDVDY